MEDRMIEIARFQQAADAEMLANLLRSEGIECYVQNGLSGSLLFGNDAGGARVEILEKDVSRAAVIMVDHGYEVELPESYTSENREQADYEQSGTGLSKDPSEPPPASENQEQADYEQGQARLSKIMTIIILLIVVLFVLLVFLNKHYKGEL
ncbi:MAG: DUF2007 domain-containing protein [Tannerella sp.]|jgi:hypothetical protein|nr:DUF2007 domain-containing protein [Tannerella sp.]